MQNKLHSIGCSLLKKQRKFSFNQQRLREGITLSPQICFPVSQRGRTLLLPCAFSIQQCRHTVSALSKLQLDYCSKKSRGWKSSKYINTVPSPLVSPESSIGFSFFVVPHYGADLWKKAKQNFKIPPKSQACLCSHIEVRKSMQNFPYSSVTEQN